ncbi:MAG: hypothetical protein FJZ01_00780 [Candidatus Sericytochromatia bacterium]|nr:hypothetical protein [Candidatus Tanganyikabacteria bacterium]
MALFLTGCGFTSAFDIAKKLTSTSESNRLKLLPSWPLGLRVELGEAKIAWGKVQKQLDDKIVQSGASVSEDASGVPVITPPATDIPPVKLGEKLRVDATTKQDIATVSIGIPITSHQVPGVTVKLSDTPAGQTLFPFPPPIGNQTLASAKTIAGAQASSIQLPQPASLDRTETQTQNIQDVQSATLASGSLTVPLVNDTAGTLTVTVTLKDGTNQTLGTDSKSLGPRSTGQILIDISGKTITAPLVTTIQTQGNIPQGTTLDKINPDTDKVSAGPIGLSMDATQANVHIAERQGSNPSGAGYDANLKDIVQSFDISGQIPSDSGIKRITSVKVSSGSLDLDMTNNFGVDTDLRIRFDGLTGISTVSGSIVRNTQDTVTLEVNANNRATASIPLAGCIITPNAQTGKITAVVSPRTLDTDNDRSHPRPVPPAKNYVLVNKTDSLAGSVTMTPMAFEYVEGDFDRTQPLPNSDVPVSLPKEFTDTGIQPARVSIKLTIKNQSMINGKLIPVMTGIATGGTQIPITFDAETIGSRVAFNGDFTGATSTGATADTVIEINEKNSNIVSALQAGITTLRFGGSTKVTGNGIKVTQDDVIGGKVDIEIPLAVIVQAFGPGSARKPFDLEPANPLDIDDSTRDQIDKYLKGAAIEFRVENGWGLPLNLGILMSTNSVAVGPYAPGAAAISRTISLGSGPVTLSTVDLTEEEAKKLGSLKCLGVRIGSPGTGGKIVELMKSSQLKIRIAVRLKLQIGPELAGGLK